MSDITSDRLTIGDTVWLIEETNFARNVKVAGITYDKGLIVSVLIADLSGRELAKVSPESLHSVLVF